MLGILYLIFCALIGWAITSFVFPNLGSLSKDKYSNKINFNPFMIYIPSYFIIGTLCLTWINYILAFLFRDTRSPLFLSNTIIMILSSIVIAFTFYYRGLKGKEKIQFIISDKKTLIIELIFIFLIALLASFIMKMTFFTNGRNLNIGVTVYSDFSPHIGMIRSFSSGNNFPTYYSHFAGEDIKYHFMFHFLTGNLEYLGLRIDYAFNIPSIISFISAFMVFYVLAVSISGKRFVGLISSFFFLFRSSGTLLTYIANIPYENGIIKTLKENMDFISSTPNENWGLWNLNVYVNQRHFAFGLSIIFLLIYLFLPNFFEMFEDIKEYNENYKVSKQGTERYINRVINHCKMIFFTKEGWIIKDIKLAIASGIILGSTAFFHGAALIGCLAILFFMAILSKRRLELLIVAIITLILSLIQSKVFVRENVVSPQFLFGFIAENKTIFGVLSYLNKLLGILPIVIIAGLIFEEKAKRYLVFAFLSPLIFAFTISLTVDVTVNHKYIMISCILLSIFAASLIEKMIMKKEFVIKLIAIILIILLSATGIYDFTTLIRKNTKQNPVVLNLDDPLTMWIMEHTDSRDIFLSSNYALNRVVLGGAMLYEGWEYFAWSAGYDTSGRRIKVKQMYEADTEEELQRLVMENNISYIIVDNDNRVSESYNLNEENIKNTYEIVYQDGEGEFITTIYDTKKPIVK